MNNCKDKLIGAIQQRQAPPYVSNLSSMMRQKALFGHRHHTIDVSPLLRRLLGMGVVTPSGPNPRTHIPPKTSHNTAPPFQGPRRRVLRLPLCPRGVPPPFRLKQITQIKSGGFEKLSYIVFLAVFVAHSVYITLFFITKTMT